MNWFAKLFGELVDAKDVGKLVEHLAGRHDDHQARHGSRVLAVALGSREAFVLFRGQVYVLGPAAAGGFLPGRMLSGDECRELFGAKGDACEAQRLTGRPGVRFNALPDDPSWGSILRMESSDGTVATWSFASRSVADELCARLNSLTAPSQRSG